MVAVGRIEPVKVRGRTNLSVVARCRPTLPRLLSPRLVALLLPLERIGVPPSKATASSRCGSRSRTCRTSMSNRRSVRITSSSMPAAAARSSRWRRSRLARRSACARRISASSRWCCSAATSTTTTGAVVAGAEAVPAAAAVRAAAAAAVRAAAAVAAAARRRSCGHGTHATRTACQ